MESGETVLDVEAGVRHNLQQRLLDAVKQCQIHFGARQEIAAETDLRVSTLCLEWEAVLLHGVRRSKSKPPLKQFAGRGRDEVSLWPLAQLCLSPDEVQRFQRLSQVHTDVGRGRAWLRAAINERRLENYLQLILADSNKLRVMYEPQSFLLDQERSSMLPVMAAGLSSILFSIPVDADYLNTPTRNMDIPAVATPLSIGHTSSATSALLGIQARHHGSLGEDVVVASRKKRRKKPSVSDHSPFRLAPSRSPEDTGEELEGGVANIDDENINSEMGLAHYGVGGAKLKVGGAFRGSSENLSSSPSVASVSDLEAGTPRFVALDMALLGNQSSSEAEAEAAASATALVLSATLSSSSPSSLPKPPQQTAHTLSPEELREALLVMVKAKDELEEVNKQLEAQLQEVRSERDQLSVELSQSRAELVSLSSTITSQQALERENDLLKEQLKLIVQRRDPTLQPGDTTENGTAHVSEDSVPSDPPTPLVTSVPLSSPDDKLSEMADMYGEIMELNDRLQRDLAHKDSYITRLIKAVQSAGLQVPPQTLPLSAAAKSSQLSNSSTDDRNELISVWIPSVIKKGRGPDTHHIYQVYIRIREQEWNVYRRYAEFREFHKQLQECIPEISSFQFPPKKTLGNKSVQLVEERRQRLQDYLRVVMRLCTQPRTVQGKKHRHQLDPIMKPGIDRDTMQDILPFFREDMNNSHNTSQSQRLSYSGL